MHDEQQVTRPDFKLLWDKAIKAECLIRKSGSDLIKARGNKASQIGRIYVRNHCL